MFDVECVNLMEFDEIDDNICDYNWCDGSVWVWFWICEEFDELVWSLMN